MVNEILANVIYHVLDKFIIGVLMVPPHESIQSVVIEEDVYGYLCVSIAAIYMEIQFTRWLTVPLGNSNQ